MLTSRKHAQVFEEIFQAYQQRLPEDAEAQFLEEQWVDQDKVPYDCPADKQLQVAFRQIPVTQNVGAWLLRTVPSVTIFLGSLAFVFVCLWLSIFRSAAEPWGTDYARSR